MELCENSLVLGPVAMSAYHSYCCSGHSAFDRALTAEALKWRCHSLHLTLEAQITGMPVILLNAYKVCCRVARARSQ